MMDQTHFHDFTRNLLQRLAVDDRVLALVAIGSLAQSERIDAWSDHDFWVITTTAAQAAILADLSWLPDHEAIVLTLRPAPQYCTVLYASGHMAEFAVFGPHDLTRGRLTQYQMLFDKGDITPQIQAIAADVQQAQQSNYNTSNTFGHFLITLCTGASRAARGEWLSAHTYIFQYAVDALLQLITHHLPSQRADLFDAFEPRRRFELAYPDMNKRLIPILALSPTKAALQLLKFAEALFPTGTLTFTPEALTTTRAYLQRLESEQG